MEKNTNYVKRMRDYSMSLNFKRQEIERAAYRYRSQEKYGIQSRINGCSMVEKIW
jgi:hypothetical protein